MKFLPAAEAEAKERMREGGKKGGEKAGRGRPSDTRQGSGAFHRTPVGEEARERVAKVVGVGKETLRRIEAVYEAAEENPKLAPVRESLEREERAAPAYCGSGGGSNCVTDDAATSQLL